MQCICKHLGLYLATASKKNNYYIILLVRLHNCQVGYYNDVHVASFLPPPPTPPPNPITPSPISSTITWWVTFQHAEEGAGQGPLGPERRTERGFSFRRSRSETHWRQRDPGAPCWSLPSPIVSFTAQRRAAEEKGFDQSGRAALRGVSK